jgi:cytochrome subunit of sulfide dehydrogenase
MNKKSLFAALILGGMLASPQLMADSQDPAMLSHTCAGCHGTFGASAGDSIPIIGGQPQVFLKQAMLSYKDGKRHSTIMQRLAKGYDEAQIDVMANFISSQSWVSADVKIDRDKANRGKQVHTTKGCAGCHGANGISAAPNTPRLAGQYPEYLFVQMRYYLNPQIPVPSSAMVMRTMLKGANDEDLRALAEFYASQK